MSHEMRTPMSGVLSMANMLLQGELAADQRQIVELIRESTQTMLTLVNDTMDYSRLEAGRPASESDMGVDATAKRIADALAKKEEAKRAAEAAKKAKAEK